MAQAGAAMDDTNHEVPRLLKAGEIRPAKVLLAAANQHRQGKQTAGPQPWTSTSCLFAAPSPAQGSRIENGLPDRACKYVLAISTAREGAGRNLAATERLVASARSDVGGRPRGFRVPAPTTGSANAEYRRSNPNGFNAAAIQRMAVGPFGIIRYGFSCPAKNSINSL